MRFLSLLFISVISACAASGDTKGVVSSQDSCIDKHESARLLALNEDDFDQDLAGGWRAVAAKTGCVVAAADLLAAYRASHSSSSSTLAWHEGQIRALVDDYEHAIPLLGLARKAPDEDKGGWNPYVDATIAFLEGNMDALLQARDRLSATPYPGGADMPPLKDGYVEFPSEEGQPVMKIRWPPNIDVVEGLISCFGKSYADAYGTDACRPEDP